MIFVGISVYLSHMMECRGCSAPPPRSYLLFFSSCPRRRYFLLSPLLPDCMRGGGGERRERNLNSFTEEILLLYSNASCPLPTTSIYLSIYPCISADQKWEFYLSQWSWRMARHLAPSTPTPKGSAQINLYIYWYEWRRRRRNGGKKKMLCTGSHFKCLCIFPRALLFFNSPWHTCVYLPIYI